MVELHVKRRKPLIETCCHAVVHGFNLTVYGIVGHAKAVYFAKGEEGPEAEGCGRMCLDKSVANKDSVFLADKNLFLGENHATHAICHTGYGLTIELTDILVASRRIHTALIAVQTEVEGSAMLNHCFVETRQHHMRLVVHPLDRNHQQTVLFTCVATDQSGAMVCAGLVCTQHLFCKRLVQVYEQVLIKFKITHMC